MTLKLVCFENTDTLRTYQAMMARVGERDARRAFNMALNKEGRKAFTGVKRALGQQTSIPRPIIAASTRFYSSKVSTLETRITGKGTELSLKIFGAAQFSYGVRAKVWGRYQQYRSAFIVKKLGGHVFHRLTRKRFPIEKMYGPSIPKELVKDQAVQTFFAHTHAVSREAVRVLKAVIKA